MTNDLPYGRGLRRGIRAAIDQAESFAQREQFIDVSVRSAVSPMDALLIPGSPNSLPCYATGEVWFLPLKPLSHVVEVAYAKIRVDAVASGSSLDVGLYIQDGIKTMSLVSTTRVSINTDASTGVITAELPESTTLQRGVIYAIASVASGGTPTLAMYDTLTSSTGISPIKTQSSTSLNQKIAWDTLTDSTRVRVPFVAFVSEIAEDFT